MRFMRTIILTVGIIVSTFQVANAIGATSSGTLNANFNKSTNKLTVNNLKSDTPEEQTLKILYETADGGSREIVRQGDVTIGYMAIYEQHIPLPCGHGYSTRKGLRYIEEDVAQPICFLKLSDNRCTQGDIINPQTGNTPSLDTKHYYSESLTNEKSWRQTCNCGAPFTCYGYDQSFERQKAYYYVGFNVQSGSYYYNASSVEFNNCTIDTRILPRGGNYSASFINCTIIGDISIPSANSSFSGCRFQSSTLRLSNPDRATLTNCYSSYSLDVSYSSATEQNVTLSNLSGNFKISLPARGVTRIENCSSILVNNLNASQIYLKDNSGVEICSSGSNTRFDISNNSGTVRHSSGSNVTMTGQDSSINLECDGISSGNVVLTNMSGNFSFNQLDLDTDVKLINCSGDTLSLDTIPRSYFTANSIDLPFRVIKLRSVDHTRYFDFIYQHGYHIGNLLGDLTVDSPKQSVSLLSAPSVSGKVVLNNMTASGAIDFGCKEFTGTRLTLANSANIRSNSTLSLVGSKTNSSVTLQSGAPMTLTDVQAKGPLSLNTNSTSTLDSITGTSLNVSGSSAVSIKNCTLPQGVVANNASLLIEGGAYAGSPALSASTIKIKKGTITDTNSTRSQFIIDMDSESAIVRNGTETITTVKLSNPPIIIDWSEFPQVRNLRRIMI